MTTTVEGQSVWTTTEPTLEQILSGDYTLPVNFKVVDAETSTYKTISFVFDSVNGARRLELGGGSLDQDNIFKVMNVTLEDLSLTQNSTEEEIKQALSNYIEGLQIEQKELYLFQIDGFPNGGGSVTGDFIPLTGTEEGKNISGALKFDTIDIRSETIAVGENSTFLGRIKAKYSKEGKNFETSSSFNSSMYIGVSAGEDYSKVNTSMNTSESYFILSDENTYDALGGITNQIYYLEVSSDRSVFTKFNGFFSKHLTEESALTDKHFVQKDYVDKINSYSNVGKKTGGKWIDGKNIYRKVITKTISEIGQYNYFDWVYLAESNVDNLVNITGFFTLPNGNVFPFGETVVKYSANQEEDIKYNISWWCANDLEQDLYRVLYLRGTSSTFNSTTQQWEESPISEISYNLIIEYTKTNELTNF